MQSMVDVSIVTYNSSKWLELFFKSLLAQDYPTKYLNIYIRDNASTDDTVALLNRLRETLHTHFASFDISHGKNKGFGFGHNRNFERGKSDYFLVTNVDLEFEKNAINEIFAKVQEDESEVYASFEFRQKPYEHPKYYDPVTLETRWSSSACILFRRKAFAKIKGYEERIFLYGEDVEISYRLRDNGYKLKYCPRAVCWHYSYEMAGEIKPQQFFGSIMANLYLRFRYGTFKDILCGFLMYFRVFFSRVKVLHRLSGLSKNFLTLLKNMPYFLMTRKKSDRSFMFEGWDYDWQREGSFYVLSSLPQKSLPLVSVIIRTYSNRLGYLTEAVQSVLNQTYPHIELIVIEDGSTYAKAFAERIARYDAIEKLGRSAAGNKGLSLATGEYVVFLDDDDLFFSDHIEVLVMGLLAKPHLGGIYSLAWECKTELLQKDPLRYVISTPYVQYHRQFSRAKLWASNYLPIQSVMFKRELFLKNGGFDESLETLEDWDLWLRYTLADDFALLEKVTSLYRVPKFSHESRERLKMLQKGREEVIFKQKDYFPVHLSIRDILVIANDIAIERGIRADLTLAMRKILKRIKKEPL